MRTGTLVLVLLALAAPAAAQTAPDAHHGHGQHQQQGHQQHDQHQQHQPGQTQGHGDGCCADRNGNGRMDCCERMAEASDRRGCCPAPAAQPGSQPQG